MIFQNPTSAFNPVFTIGAQMSDVLAAHDRERGDAARDRIRTVLGSVGMPDVDRVMRAYPHQLSGGMLQRAMIATALLCRPRLLIADEPTTALDVTIAAQILALLRRLQREEGFSVMLITHDLGVVRTVCDRVAVLYAGRVVETATTEALFAAPQHPYTRGLLAAVPRTSAGAGPLRTIPGSVPTDIGVHHGLCLRSPVSHRGRPMRASRRRCCASSTRCVPRPATTRASWRVPSARAAVVSADADRLRSCASRAWSRSTRRMSRDAARSSSAPSTGWTWASGWARRTASSASPGRARRRSRDACCGWWMRRPAGSRSTDAT